MQCAGPPACGHALILTNQSPAIGSNSEDLNGDACGRRGKTPNECRGGRRQEKETPKTNNNPNGRAKACEKHLDVAAKAEEGVQLWMNSRAEQERKSRKTTVLWEITQKENRVD